VFNGAEESNCRAKGFREQATGHLPTPNLCLVQELKRKENRLGPKLL
jgi:hypothetical protein